MARASASSLVVSGRTLYLNNRDLLAELQRSRQQGSMTDELAAMLQHLTFRYSKTYRFAQYSYNDDMQAAAMLSLMTAWYKFDPERGDNPFAYFTQCIKNSFKQYLRTEKQHRDLRDMMLVDQGMSPSNTYADSQWSSDDRVYVNEETGDPTTAPF